MTCADFNPAFKQEARKLNLLVVTPGDPDYDARRVIANLRFDWRPCAIACCSTEEHIAFCITFCHKRGMPFRVRSGGHQHEGMCSANDVVVIDLSLMNQIEYGPDNTAWIPAGKKMSEIYQELENRNMIIPGGGCGSVCIGGLAQGGGWSPSGRRFGLTCDSFTEARVVLADGSVAVARADNDHVNLFWALRGGGGGNFGVVTKFRFQLYSILGTEISFALKWPRDRMQALVQEWIEVSPGFPNELTSVLRLTVVDTYSNDKPAVMLAGLFYGGQRDPNKIQQDLDNLLKPFIEIAKPASQEFTPRTFPKAEPQNARLADAKGDHANGHYTNGHLELGRYAQPQAQPPAQPHARLSQAPPAETCDAPHPHKISSAFPDTPDTPALARKITDYITGTVESKSANQYLSLMSMGGAVKNKPQSPFPFRNKEFVMQFQAWWSDPHDPNGPMYVDWIESFRSSFGLSIAGAFINFPDRGIDRLTADANKQILLRPYYGEPNLRKLSDVKRMYDPNNLFSFEMSIPVAPRE